MAICKGTPKQLTATTKVTSSYSWSPATGLDDETSAAPNASPVTTTRYVVTATNANGCVNKYAVLVRIHQPDIAIVTPPSGICKGESTIIKASGGTTYEWKDADQLVVTPENSTTYKLTVTDNICQTNQIKVD